MKRKEQAVKRKPISAERGIGPIRPACQWVGKCGRRCISIQDKSNGWERIITNNNSWQWTQPFEDGDIVLEYVL